MRVFMSAGEPSGDMLAASLAEAMRARRPDIAFEGIGGERMAAAGFSLAVRNRGWASIGLFGALLRVAPLLVSGFVQAARLRRRPPDLVVLIDFGAFNLRLAGLLRAFGYGGPILYYVPPGAWLDSASQARKVARLTTALTAFARQRDFYRSLGLPIAYFGHPLVSLIEPRAPRPAPPADGGCLALLPGSRVDEVRRILPRLLDAGALLRANRPRLEIVISVANDECAALVSEALPHSNLSARVERGAGPALEAADAALIASGTAVLEAALRGVPTIAVYVVSPKTAEYLRRVWHGAHFTLPNLLLKREVVPEFWQAAATPAALAASAEGLLRDPLVQRDAFRDLRAVLDGADAQERAAEFALALARGESVS